jgi:acyl-CoA reductase-like NAD-dependent aldehyde dehydrogenase
LDLVIYHSILQNLPSFTRKEILLQIASKLNERSEEISRVITLETGKPIKDARVEVIR